MREEGEDFGMKSRVRQTLEGIALTLFVAGALTVGIMKGCEDKKNQTYFNNLPTREYIVKPGDRLYNFADDYLKKETQENMNHTDIVDRVRELNPGLDPGKLQPGQRVYLPCDVE